MFSWKGNSFILLRTTTTKNFLKPLADVLSCYLPGLSHTSNPKEITRKGSEIIVLKLVKHIGMWWMNYLEKKKKRRSLAKEERKDRIDSDIQSAVSYVSYIQGKFCSVFLKSFLLYHSINMSPCLYNGCIQLYYMEVSKLFQLMFY